MGLEPDDRSLESFEQSSSDELRSRCKLISERVDDAGHDVGAIHADDVELLLHEVGEFSLADSGGDDGDLAANLFADVDRVDFFDRVQEWFQRGGDEPGLDEAHERVVVDSHAEVLGQRPGEPDPALVDPDDRPVFAGADLLPGDQGDLREINVVRGREDGLAWGDFDLAAARELFALGKEVCAGGERGSVCGHHRSWSCGLVDWNFWRRNRCMASSSERAT